VVAFATSAKDGSDDYDIFEILAGLGMLVVMSLSRPSE